MNIEEKIHERWAADGTLNGLLPATDFTTGIHFAEEPTFPYATLTRPGDVPIDYHNDDSSLENVQIRITVYHQKSSYDEGLAITDAVKAAFDRSTFDLTGSGDKVLCMQRLSFTPLQDDVTGDWFFLIDYSCQVFLGVGV